MGKRFVDKLVRVNVLNGDEKWNALQAIERLGMVKGRVESQYSLLKRLLERRFSLLPEWA